MGSAATVQKPRRRRAALRAAVAIVGGLVVVLFGISLLVGRFATYPVSYLAPPADGPRTPAWTRPCWRHLDRPRPYLLKCGRVRGVVVWVQRHDPDGDGDRHLLVVAGYHLVSVKIPKTARVPRLPRIASVVTATGLLERGGHGESTIRVGALDQ